MRSQTVVELRNFRITRGGGTPGTGIAGAAGSTTTAINSLVSENSTLVSSGGIGSSGLLYVTNTTVTGNSADVSAGGIAGDATGTAFVTSSTVADNVSLQGGAIGTLVALTLANTLIEGDCAILGAAGPPCPAAARTAICRRAPAPTVSTCRQTTRPLAAGPWYPVSQRLASSSSWLIRLVRHDRDNRALRLLRDANQNEAVATKKGSHEMQVRAAAVQTVTKMAPSGARTARGVGCCSGQSAYGAQAAVPPAVMGSQG